MTFAAVNPMATTTLPELKALKARLREILGAHAFESLARNGEAMTVAAMVTYAFDQIDEARTDLNAISDPTT